jgi:hypothetical protein
MSSDRDLLLEIHRQIEEDLGIGQFEPKAFDRPGRANPTGLRAVSNAGETGIPTSIETIERRTQAQGSARGGPDRPEESSKSDE